MLSDQNKELGKYLCRKRIQAGITQVELAEKLKNPSVEEISLMEQGLKAFPVNYIFEYVRFCNIPEREILAIIDKKK